MSIITIPVINDKDYYNFSFILDNVIYKIIIRYIYRNDKWYLSLDSIFYNRVIVGGCDLLKQYKHLKECPKGELRAVDKDGIYRDVNKENFSENILLQYIEP